MREHMKYEYIGNLPPEEQDKLVEYVAKKFGHGDEWQKRQMALDLVIPVLELGVFAGS